MRVLFVSPYVPSPVRVRPYYWIKYLSALGHEIVLVTLASGSDSDADLAAMRRICARVRVISTSPLRAAWNCVRAISAVEPFQLACMRDPSVDRVIRAEQSRATFDVAHIEHLRGAGFADGIRGLPIVYDAVDSISLLFDQTRRHGPRLRDRVMARLDWKRTEQFEATMLDRFARVLVAAAADAEHVARLAGASARRPVILPHPVDLAYFRPAPDSREAATLVFSGKMSYHANIAAARFLVRDVMPIVWSHRPDVRVSIVGQAPDRSVRALARDARVVVTGRVPDLRPFLTRASLAICPMLYGTGLQNKILEAMATATPVVASARAARALMAVPGRDLAVAETPHEFSEQVLTLLASKEQRESLGARGRAYVDAHHAGTVLATELEATYRQAVSEGQAPEPRTQ